MNDIVKLHALILDGSLHDAERLCSDLIAEHAQDKANAKRYLHIRKNIFSDTTFDDYVLDAMEKAVEDKDAGKFDSLLDECIARDEAKLTEAAHA